MEKFLSTYAIFLMRSGHHIFFNHTIIFLTQCVILFFLYNYFLTGCLCPPPYRIVIIESENNEAYLLYFYLFVYMYLRAHVRIPLFLYPRGMASFRSTFSRASFFTKSGLRLLPQLVFRATLFL
jgi:hypothetical protein